MHRRDGPNQQNQTPNHGTYAHRTIGSHPGGGQSQCGGPHSPCASTTAEPGTDTANAATIRIAITTRLNIPLPSFHWTPRRYRHESRRHV